MKDQILVEYRAEVGVFLLVVFGLASFFGIIGALFGKSLPGELSAFQDIVNWFGAWVNWLALAGIIGFLILIWWMADYISKIKKLKDLIDTESKAKFLKNMDEIDFIAWRLPMKYKMLVSNKKSELKITQ